MIRLARFIRYLIENILGIILLNLAGLDETASVNGSALLIPVGWRWSSSSASSCDRLYEAIKTVLDDMQGLGRLGRLRAENAGAVNVSR